MSSSFFQDIMTNVTNVEQELLGPDYQYYKYINTPSEMGMSTNGDLGTLGKDVNGLISYVELLVAGNGNASKTGQPLGNKFFMKTGAKCMGPDKKEKDRYIYINNVPNGNIPFISAGLGVDFGEFRGLIPGAMEDLNTLSPYGIMQAFLTGSTPPCQEITMETIGVDNRKGLEKQYVTDNDIQRIDACSFNVSPMPGKPAGVNPMNPKLTCRQAFQNMSIPLSPADFDKDFPENPVHQMYFICLAVLGIFLLYKIAGK
jgi:hypothetical protein